MDFFELEVVSEFADGRLVLAMFIVKILAVNTRKVLFYVSKEKYGKSKKRTKTFTENYDVELTTSKQWIWRRQRQDDGLQSAFQVLRMTGTENKLPVCRRRVSRRGAWGIDGTLIPTEEMIKINEMKR